MTTQPVSPNLSAPTEVPILGISGPLSSLESVSTGFQEAGVKVGSEYLVTTFPVANTDEIGKVLYYKTFLLDPEFILTPDLMRFLFSTQSIFYGYIIRFEPVKLSGSEVRMATTINYTLGGNWGATSLANSTYSVTNEFNVSSASDTHSAFLDFAHMNQPLRNYITPSTGYNPKPLTRINVLLRTKYQTTPIHPDNFDCLVYATPVFKTFGKTTPIYRQIEVFSTNRNLANVNLSSLVELVVR